MKKDGDTCIGFAGSGYEGMRTFAGHGIALEQNGAVNIMAARFLMPFRNIHLENA